MLHFGLKNVVGLVYQSEVSRGTRDSQFALREGLELN